MQNVQIMNAVLTPRPPRSMSELEAQLTQEAVADLRRLPEILDSADQRITDLWKSGNVPSTVRYHNNLPMFIKRVKFGVASIAMRAGVSNTVLADLMNNRPAQPQPYQWPQDPTQWSVGPWHEWPGTRRHTKEPVTSFSQRIIDALARETNRMKEDPELQAAFDATYKAAVEYHAPRHAKYDTNNLVENYEPNVLAAVATLCTIRYLQQVGHEGVRIPEHALDPRGDALGRVLMTLANMSGNDSGRFHGTHGMSAFERPDYQKDPIVKMFPTPDPESPLKWRTHEVFVYGPPKPGRPSTLHIPQTEILHTDEEYCPARGVRTERPAAAGEDLNEIAFAFRSPIRAIGALTAAYEAGLAPAFEQEDVISPPAVGIRDLTVGLEVRL